MKTPLITREGLEKLKAELDHLWRVERRDTTQKVSWAASNGDRSENADYHYNKRRLREIDRRIRFLTTRIDAAEVVDPEAPRGGGAAQHGLLPLHPPRINTPGPVPCLWPAGAQHGLS